MLFLVATWHLLVMPNVSQSMPSPKQFEIERVYFSSMSDCQTAGKLWLPDMADAAVSQRHEFRRAGMRKAPADISATFTCVERDTK